MAQTPEQILKTYWGYDQFRANQREIIDFALQGQDVLALLPTGGGKSICYQVPALCMEGTCIVVSPLIALMKDQVEQLKRRGIAAAAVFSGMNHRALDIVFENAANGAYKLLYLSPERLQTELAIARIQRMRVNLLAVDEAHCISQWGYDFRPPYLQIANIRAYLPKVPVMALTATATAPVIEDIQLRLGFKTRNVVRQSFLRTNLSYSVIYEPDKIQKTVEILKRVPGTAVVYSRNRGETKMVAGILNAEGISADYYHAGLNLEERNRKQEDWIQNRTRVICSTNAFGMGIDKPDVRLVIHLSLPDSLEAYFQEAGRGGRDGKKAYAVLLYDQADGESLRYTLGVAYPPLDTIRRIYNALCNYCQIAIGSGEMASFPFEMAHFLSTFRIEEYLGYSCLRILETDGWFTLSESGIARSKVMVLLSSEKSYDYQVRKQRGASVLQVILRGYPGVQSDLVEISESVIASHLKTTAEEVVKELSYLQSAGVLEYVPKTVQPQITFLRERVHEKNLTIDLAAYNFRKERATEKVEKAIYYAESRRCRSILLLEYFDETDARPCGICDICTGRNASSQTGDSIVNSGLAQKILRLVRREPQSVREVIEAWPAARTDAIKECIQALLDQGLLQLSDDKLSVPDK